MVHDIMQEIDSFRNLKQQEPLRRTTRTPNDILLHEEYAEVVIRDRYQNIVALSKIDLDDVEKVSQHKWSFNKGKNMAQGSKTFIHRLVTDCPKGMEVDHINHDRMDNRKSNLRIVDHKTNTRNQPPRAKPTIIHVSDYTKNFTQELTQENTRRKNTQKVTAK